MIVKTYYSGCNIDDRKSRKLRVWIGLGTIDRFYFWEFKWQSAIQVWLRACDNNWNIECSSTTSCAALLALTWIVTQPSLPSGQEA